MRFAVLFSALALAACGSSSSEPETCAPWVGDDPGLGATFDDADCRLSLRAFSESATRVEAWLYSESVGAPKLVSVLERGSDGVFSIELSRPELSAAGLDGSIYYGYRVWGPNWPYQDDWEPGTNRGLRQDVDGDGNRFNPNKLVVDPYALEQSHDPGRDMANFATGPDYRDIDTGPTGPKGVVISKPATDALVFDRPGHARSRDVIYEVHVRGLTKNDASIPEALRGTYAGAAMKAAYLRELGVTAIELLPVHETNNEYNGEVEGQAGGNYWGYASLSFFAPERRYAADQSPGGPTREIRDMVRAFHAEGIKVYIDVVYNHTAETGVWDPDGRTTMLLSWRGLDNATYYQLGDAGHEYRNDNGVGPNIAVAHPRVGDMIVDSLRYWHEVIGVDGYRFDLASILGNECDAICFNFQASGDSLLARIGSELPTADLVAEPWSATSYQLGEFLAPWSEWNDNFRDLVRRHINKEGVEPVTPRELTTRLGGSPDRFADDGRQPWHSINFVNAHDGFTLIDTMSCNEKNNNQEWPFGPSPGGSNNNISWDHGGDPLAQREAARTAMALLFIAPGVPMFTGGDEHLRSQGCNNNMFNLDNEANWLDWQSASAGPGADFTDFVRALATLRAENAALRPESYWSFTDGNGNGRPDAEWLTDLGVRADDAYLDDAGRRFIGLSLDGSEQGDGAEAIYVGYNGATITVIGTLPPAPPQTTWRLVVDTASGREASGNSGLDEGLDATIAIAPRSLIIAVAR